MRNFRPRYDFIPATISVGRFGGSNGFVSCRYKYKNWRNVGVFERLCKYKPHDQRDPETQLKKAIYNAVSVIENTPVSGFSFIDYGKDLYNLYSHYCDDIVLNDPRGFDIAIPADNWYYMLNCAGDNMTNGKISHQFAYAWSADNQRFILVDAETDEFAEIKKASDDLKNVIDTGTYVAKKDLVVGKVYKGSVSFPGLYMYLGEHNVYSEHYHLTAYENGKYDSFEEFAKKKEHQDITSEKKMVFYLLSDGKNGRSYEYKTPFKFKASVSKLFEYETNVDGSEFKFLNFDDRQATYDTIKRYMEVSPLFNKIDMKTLKMNSAHMSFNVFDMLFNYDKVKNIDDIVFPFKAYNCYAMSFMCGNQYKMYRNRYVKLNSYRYGTSLDIRVRNSIRNSWSSHEIDHLNGISVAQLYSEIKPLVSTAKFENGNDVAEIYMAMLNYDKTNS